MSLAPEQVLRLAPGCRIGAAQGQEDVLLIPEGALRLKGPARSIVELCNGERTLAQVVEELRRLYSPEDPAAMEAEVVSFLSGLRDRGVIETA